ncbi:MAG TPA: response regulator [Methylocella sp.]|nr:response regulator [Methylocella sp.]
MSKTILTVDDSRTMRDMLMLALSNAGYSVLQAVDGVDGLEVLQNAAPDVIITDINMPRMDGFGFIEGVRGSARHRAVPILVLTTESDAAKKDRARRAGATGWIVKPFDPVKLVDAIRRVAA